MLNKVTLIGNLCGDVELYEGDTLRARARLATTELWTDANGETQERTEWHNYLTLWGRRAETFAKLKKGDLIYIEGKIRNRRWEQDDQTFYRTEIHIDSYRCLKKADAPKKTTPRRKKAA